MYILIPWSIDYCTYIKNHWLYFFHVCFVVTSHTAEPIQSQCQLQRDPVRHGKESMATDRGGVLAREGRLAGHSASAVRKQSRGTQLTWVTHFTWQGFTPSSFHSLSKQSVARDQVFTYMNMWRTFLIQEAENMPLDLVLKETSCPETTCSLLALVLVPILPQQGS